MLEEKSENKRLKELVVCLVAELSEGADEDYFYDVLESIFSEREIKAYLPDYYRGYKRFCAERDG